jgi:acetyl esterase/lipase
VLPIAVTPRVLRFLLFMLSNVLIFFAVACPSASAQGKVVRNVVYCNELQKSCIGDLYEQDDPQLRPAPAVVVVHGGSWVTGDWEFPLELILP